MRAGCPVDGEGRMGFGGVTLTELAAGCRSPFRAFSAGWTRRSWRTRRSLYDRVSHRCRMRREKGGTVFYLLANDLEHIGQVKGFSLVSGHDHH